MKVLSRLKDTRFFPNFYGLWIVITYLAFKVLVPTKIIETFASGALMGGAVLCILLKSKMLPVLKSLMAWFRGVSFGLTQFFIFQALIHGDTTTVFATTSASFLFLLPLVRIFLRETISKREVFCAITAIVGATLIAPSLTITLYGVLSGVFQATSIVFARKIERHASHLLGNVALGLLLAGMFSLCLSSKLTFLSVKPICILFFSSLIILTQVYFIWLTLNFTANVVNQISQTRIFWSLALNVLLSQQFPSFNVLVGAIMSGVAGFLIIPKNSMLSEKSDSTDRTDLKKVYFQNNNTKGK